MRILSRSGFVALTALMLTTFVAQAQAQFPPPPLTQTHTAGVKFNGPQNDNFKFQVKIPGENNGNYFTTWAGDFTVTIASRIAANDTTGTLVGSYRSYCVDLYENSGESPPYEANLTFQNGLVPDTFAGAVGQVDYRNIGAAAWLFYNEASLFAGLSIFNPLLTLDQKEAAMQIAIWEATFDGAPGDSSNLTAGNFQIKNSSGLSGVSATEVANQDEILAAANNLLTTAWTGSGYKQSSAVFVNFEPPSILPSGTRTRQDQLIRPVPEPATLLSGVLTLGLLAGLRLRRQKRA